MPDRAWLIAHVALLRASYRRLIGADLVPAQLSPPEALEAVLAAPYALLSHDTRDDPVFNFVNPTAQALFAMDWATFTVLPSRYSAEASNREERARLMQQVTDHGYIADYQGIRIARTGRRFRISGATVWNLADEAGIYRGQAALLPSWEFLPD